MSVSFNDYLRLPGPQAVRDTVEANILWNKGALAIYDFGAVIDGASTDAGNTGFTTTLRGGLLLGKVAASGKLKPWSATATDGTQLVYGVQPFDLKMVDGDGNGQDRTLGVLIGGWVKNAAVFSAAGALDQQARQQMRGRFWFDDDFAVPPGLFYPWRTQLSKTGNYAVTAADNGTLFDNTGAAGAVNFTLPAIADGLSFGFLAVADQNLTVTSAEGGNLITFNNAAATSVSLQTAANRIGGLIRVYANPGATKWITELPAKNTVTVA